MAFDSNDKHDGGMWIATERIVSVETNARANFFQPIALALGLNRNLRFAWMCSYCTPRFAIFAASGSI